MINSSSELNSELEFNSGCENYLAQKLLAGVLILAGGLSTRMGSPKAKLLLPSGETLLDYHVCCSAQLGVPILIADNQQGFTTELDVEDCAITHIKDYQPRSSHSEFKQKHSAGPLGAIVAGMQQLLGSSCSNIGSSDSNDLNDSDSKWLLVVSCDSLVNTVDIWQYVTTHALTADAFNTQRLMGQHTQPQPQIYCLADNERDYPLLALYQVDLAQSLQAYLDSGERRVMRFISPIGQSLAMPKAWYSLSNLNTPEQFEAACQQLFG
ncbi:molybdenum cofactor guanylyltransferase [Psychrobacter sp. FDAARGOS_221]|uniref:molybdenum cofactor guanylyltransferase n=1 Tax=Psychrobacter sp. FDAARGOS_221 TaxID=1975705 RepID=UPI000BB545FF|nr:NTP transferase domain-containing protein [Psychrobacter sp. FDAARGOS_221]PNK60522.1 molybdopterin-guanine dinucleotide biosynthesis protein MobA [Psychrobacter sp. FDAARGOS_221]